MGWDGVCIFEEQVNFRWVRIAEVNIQHLVYRVNGSLHSSFVDNDPLECDDSDNGDFLWSDLVAATDEDLENGHFRTANEIIARLSDVSMDSLVAALLDPKRMIRACCHICC